jgi:hypothetical protein
MTLFSGGNENIHAVQNAIVVDVPWIHGEFPSFRADPNHVDVKADEARL